MRRTRLWLALVLSASGPGCGDVTGDAASAARAAADLPAIAVTRHTPALHRYDDAPRTPDADDPAIWIHPRDPARSLVIAAQKLAGLGVYDLSGQLVQTVVPAFRPPVDAADPPVPGEMPDPGTAACPGASGETFGRFNNVDLVYGFELADHHGRRRRVDLAVVTDRGCDRLRIFAIDPARPRAPLTEVTSPRAGRIFPERFVQPSPVQPGGEPPGVTPNDLDAQNTGYGLAVYDPPGPRAPRAFVTQRHRARVAELSLVPEPDGTVGYRRIRELRFPVAFDVGAAAPWAPCREDVDEEPQLEGMVVDAERGVLYASQEVVGVWRIELSPALPAVVRVPARALVQRTRSFGQAYWAVPDGDEFTCIAPQGGAPPDGTIAVPGSPGAAGDTLVADVEGLAIYHAGSGGGYLLVSSQGDDTYHAYDLRDPRRRVASFQIRGTAETDGHEVTNVGLGSAFPHGLFVTQNGKAPPPGSVEPIHGFSYDGSTQFQLVDWNDIAAPLGLAIDTRSFDPRGADRDP